MAASNVKCNTKRDECRVRGRDLAHGVSTDMIADAVARTAMNHKVIALPLLLLCFAGTQAQTLGALSDADVERGCGCSFHVPPQAAFRGSRILQWQDGGQARARINGSLVLLDVGDPVSSTPSTRREQVGDNTTYTLKGGNTQIVAACTATVVCKQSDESCEATQYSAVLHIQSSAARSQVKAWAVCGC